MSITSPSSPRLAVIIPVYKVEPYLRQCIESVQRQTFTSLRIILVDDGSPDSCGAICEEYAREDDRILVLHKENGGLSSARNHGLEYIGDCPYVTYLDSDDWLELDTYERCIEALEREPDLDLVGFGFEEVYSDRISARDIQSHSGRYTRAEVLNRYVSGLDIYVYPAVWQRVYRREVIEGLRFVEGHSMEDVCYTFQVFWRCSAYRILPFSGLHYRVERPGAITEKITQKNGITLFEDLEQLIKEGQHNPSFAAYANALLVNYIWNYYMLHLHDEEAYNLYTRLYKPFLVRARKRRYLNCFTKSRYYRRHLLFLYFTESFMRYWRRREYRKGRLKKHG